MMCTRLIYLASFVAAVLSLVGNAQAIEPSADTYIRGSASSAINYGGETQLLVKNNNGGNTDRKIYIRFDVGGKTAEASLDLTVSVNNEGGGGTTPQTFTVEVYGLAESLDHTWTETDITWNNAPANSTSNHNFTADATFLGSFVVDQLSAGDTVSFSDPALADFINTDTDGQVTLLLRRTTGNASHNLGFASKENTSGYTPPTLNTAVATAAYRPNPADGDIVEATWTTLSWSPGHLAAFHNVYVGDNFDDVDSASPDSPVFQGSLTETLVIAGFFGYPLPDGLVPGTTYYWRIDEVNDADPNSPWKGPVWSFSIPPRAAYNPSPADGATYVDTDTDLGWTAGLNAKLHNVVFGDSFDDVNSAPAGTPAGATTFTPGTLEKGRTYYWRVDEVDPPTTTRGMVWSFTTMPVIPVTDPNMVGWWKFEVGEGDRVIDWSGHGNHGTIVDNVLWVPGQFNLALEFLGDNEGHVELPAGMVTTASGSVTMWVNTDQVGNAGMLWYGTESGGDGFGGENEVHIHVGDSGALGFAMEGSTDVRLGGPTLAGAGWNHVAATWDETDGCKLYFNGIQSDFQPYTANVANLSIIRLGRPVATGNGNRYYDGLMDDVRLFDHPISANQINEIMTKGEDPLRAGNPSPGNGSVAPINLATTLGWSAGEGASRHDVYLGTDKGAVASADSSDTTGVYRGRQNATSYTPPEGVQANSGPLFWRIDEVAGDGSIVQGSVWKYSVAGYALVENFETYNDIESGQPGSNLVYETWADGYGVPTNGSTMGYVIPFEPTMESANVHGGQLSAPMAYDNTGAASSEVTRTFTPARDWTANGIQVLSLWFHGDMANAPGQLYVKINGVKVPYNGAAGDLAVPTWMVWNIDLASVGTNLRAVTSLAIGVEGFGAAGTLLLDDIRLYQSIQDAPAQVLIEAEAGVLGAGWRLYNDPASLGGRHIGSENGDGDDNDIAPGPLWTATYSFDAPAAGVYKVLLRARESDSDSLWVRIVGATGQTHEDPDQPGTGWVRFNGIDAPDEMTWDEVHSDDHNQGVVNWTLPAGALTLEIGKREDGVLLDAILITSDID